MGKDGHIFSWMEKKKDAKNCIDGLQTFWKAKLNFYFLQPEPPNIKLHNFVLIFMPKT